MTDIEPALYDYCNNTLQENLHFIKIMMMSSSSSSSSSRTFI